MNIAVKSEKAHFPIPTLRFAEEAAEHSRLYLEIAIAVEHTKGKPTMLICVDGTGPFVNSSYKTAMANSFTRQIWKHSGLRGARLYYRGPDNPGLLTNMARPGTLVKRDILPLYKKGDTRICMVGYSRGGAIVINTAAVLKKHGVPVEALFLFDAVDRSIELEADLIPSNVKHAYHAVRHRETGSRTSFGNCGIKAAAGVKFHQGKPTEFWTTHGGMGGTPWGLDGLIGTNLALADRMGACRHQVPRRITAEAPNC